MTDANSGASIVAMVNNNLKSIRERLGLTQDDFALEIGCSQGNVSHYECQRQDVPPDVAHLVIGAAKKRGIAISFDDIYVLTEPSAAEQKKAA
ncbi:hypothetical protein SDC9_182171 [bioreactor metagenome]|uniref:HTH cro/C1-type domain-containing protein n=1 Tax=bioreactor metagenome TaxID=1076179 RepID=A0A645H6M2_9ZZZZ